MAEINWRQPKPTESCGNETPLKYASDLGTQNIDILSEEFGDLTVMIEENGTLYFEYYVSQSNYRYEEPDGEMVITYWVKCSAVESAKEIAEIVALDIERTTKQRWSDFGFTREEA